MENRLQETIEKTVDEMLNACVSHAKNNVCMPGDMAQLAAATAELIKAAAAWKEPAQR